MTRASRDRRALGTTVAGKEECLMGAGPGRGPGGRGPQVAMGVQQNAALLHATFRCHGRKREYPTMAEAEVGMPPSQSPYKCPFGPNDHWHRVTRRAS